MNSISEKIIEDILCADKSILAEILNVVPSDLSLIARQKVVPSGKLDLFYLCNDELLLIELKVVDFYHEIINQINGYYSDLLALQKQNKLIHSDIRKIIIVTKAKPVYYIDCKNENIQLITYNPEDVLQKFYENFKELSHFLTIQSGDYGMVRLGLLNSTLKFLGDGLSIKEISKKEKKSTKTISNRISVARLLNLVAKFRNEYFLTDLGNQFNEQRENTDDRLGQGQLELLANFLKENPFYSSITFTIFSLIETVFVLSKNTYPVPKDAIEDYFVKSVGKTTTWKTERARETATYIFSNYASELEFLIKINNHFYITPKGIQAILLLQLNRSIKLIESRK
ncbi:MAG: hypothetical protein H8D45_21935 [Bacteroidetes bacterium]|nr:hypothetical protein [Bacteroidota bacterium]MBL7103817.1 hypothetical protein [Bacteroidales bacterium]